MKNEHRHNCSLMFLVVKTKTCVLFVFFDGVHFVCRHITNAQRNGGGGENNHQAHMRDLGEQYK